MIKKLNPFEKEFKKVVQSTQKEINSQLKIADKAIKNAIKISEKTGIPFSQQMSEYSNRWYIPKTFNNKFVIDAMKNNKFISDAGCHYELADEFSKIFNCNIPSIYEDQGGVENIGWVSSSDFC